VGCVCFAFPFVMENVLGGCGWGVCSLAARGSLVWAWVWGGDRGHSGVVSYHALLIFTWRRGKISQRTFATVCLEREMPWSRLKMVGLCGPRLDMICTGPYSAMIRGPGTYQEPNQAKPPDLGPA
jgi:hypothetical protein